MIYRTLDERLAIARSSKNLKLKEYACDVDKLIASGFAARRHALGRLASWAYAEPTKKSARILVNALQVEAVKVLRRNRRFAHRDDIRHLSAVVVNWWLDHKCKTCQGRGLYVLRDKQITTNHECHTCKGTGLKRIPTAQEVGLDWTVAVYERNFTLIQMIIEEAANNFRVGVMRALRNE